MLIDTHLHTSEHSLDSHLPVRQAIARARAMGLDGLCLTDHDTMGWRDGVDALRRETGFPLFPGMEYLTTDGDFVVFGLEHVPYPRLSARALLELVDAVGGVAVACHPYRNNGRGVGDRLLSLPGMFGVECFNGSTSPGHNLQALAAARARGLPMLGAGDAHLERKVGTFATRVGRPVRDVPELIRAVRAGDVSPVVYEEDRFVDVFASDYYRTALRADSPHPAA